MDASTRNILTGGLLFLLFCVIGVEVYMTFGGLTLLEALYTVAITISTVGYGLHPNIESDPSLMLFTSLFCVVNVVASAYVVVGMVQLLAAGELNRVLGARRMTQGISKLDAHTVVCGYGRVGQILAHDLAKAGMPFVIIDTNQDRLHDAEGDGYFVVAGSAIEEDTLQAAGIERAKTAAVVMSDDTANVFVTLTVRDLNPLCEIIARAEQPSTEVKLLRSGARRVVLPAQIGADRIAALITHPSAEEVLVDEVSVHEFNSLLGTIGMSMTELPIVEGSDFDGKTLQDVEVAGG
ncbi:MAG: NAD(P)-binding protein, partial [Planctomycetota bacterium]